jgi:hypothetical protein
LSAISKFGSDPVSFLVGRCQSGISHETLRTTSSESLMHMQVDQCRGCISPGRREPFPSPVWISVFCHVLSTNDVFRWIRELEMIFLMVDDSFNPYDVPHHYSPENICLVSTSKHIEFAPEQMANQVLRHLLGMLSSAPCLRQLNSIIPPTWTRSDFNCHWQMPFKGEDEHQENCMRDDCLADLGYGRPLVTYLFHSGAWKDLEAFFHLELPFHVSITRTYRPAEKWISQRAVERLFKNARRCGIWDQREALEDGENGIHKPAVCLEVDPDEIMRDMRQLFQETG